MPRPKTPAQKAPDGTPDRTKQQDSGQDRPHRWPGQDEPELSDLDTPLTKDESRRHPEGREGLRYPGYLDSRREDEGD